MTMMSATEMIMMERMDAEHAERVVGTLQVAVSGVSEFLRNFPEIKELYDKQALEVEIAHILISPITNAYSIGFQAREDAEETEEQAK